MYKVGTSEKKLNIQEEKLDYQLLNMSYELVSNVLALVQSQTMFEIYISLLKLQKIRRWSFVVVAGQSSFKENTLFQK